jgi:hypothetical protein
MAKSQNSMIVKSGLLTSAVADMFKREIKVGETVRGFSRLFSTAAKHSSVEIIEETE